MPLVSLFFIKRFQLNNSVQICMSWENNSADSPRYCPIRQWPDLSLLFGQFKSHTYPDNVLFDYATSFTWMPKWACFDQSD